MSSSNKRNSMLPPVAQHGPKPPVKLSSTLTIADSAILAGTNPIVIMSESVVHPRCRLESTIGGARAGGVTIGDYVTIEAMSVIEAGGTDIGDGTVIGIGAKVGAGARIGKSEFVEGNPASISGFHKRILRKIGN
ncbi:unnamed protein product [Parascedosporium putredinis]|uniref:Dynactin subunit 6 n=1 Tax=Parascedosporium putredinis TaxID=1442378 RepID=A0A9P1H617_9PEZI|nr:unnamed protein product [Parascedosporium putredinis]CAI7999857.1 unnamed protein product [Parascedosporium putredinis]